MRLLRIRTFASALGVLLAVTTMARAKVVHVDTVQGIYHAIASAQAGDTIEIKPGPYTMHERTMRLGAMGTAAKPIILRAEGNSGYATLHITAPGAVSMHIDGAYWILRGISIEGNSTTEDVVQIKSNQGHGHGSHITLVDCKVSGGSQAAIKSSFVLGKNGLADDDDNLIDHCEFYNVGKTALDLDGGINWVVRDNYVHDYNLIGPSQYGIYIKGGAINGLIEGNLVDGGSRSGTAGISFGDGRMGKQWLRKLPNGQYAPEMLDGICRNNIVANADLGYHSNDSRGCRYLNNLAYNCKHGFQRQHGYAPGPTLINNLLSGNIRRAGVVKDTLTGVKKSWFVDPDHDNFTLTEAGKKALKSKAIALKDNPVDYFGERRTAPYTLGPVNADETTSTMWVDARVTGKPTPLPKQTAH